MSGRRRGRSLKRSLVILLQVELAEAVPIDRAAYEQSARRTTVTGIITMLIIVAIRLHDGDEADHVSAPPLGRGPQGRRGLGCDPRPSRPTWTVELR